MVFNESTAKLFVFASLGFALTANLFSILSCDLLEYDVPSDGGGTLGLYKYGVKGDNGGECFPFNDTTKEDDTFAPARVGALVAFALGISLFALNVVHYAHYTIPHKEELFYIIGGCIQLSLSLINTIWKNDLCETFGCRMGPGSSWNGLAHILYMAATVVNLFITEPQHPQRKRHSSSSNQLSAAMLFAR